MSRKGPSLTEFIRLFGQCLWELVGGRRVPAVVDAALAEPLPDDVSARVRAAWDSPEVVSV